MTPPKLAIIDRDNTLNFASSNPESPLYYVLTPDALVLKPNVREAVQLLRAHGVQLVLATKQRCVSKGLLTRDQLFKINEYLETQLGVQFHSVYVEEVEDNKAGLYREILAATNTSPADTVLFDDSFTERAIAESMGITAHDGTDLFASVKWMLDL